MTNDASASTAPLSSRRSGPPFIDGAIANPIGKKRVLASSPAPAANAVPPPEVKMLSAANCAVPDQTTADIKIEGKRAEQRSGQQPEAHPDCRDGQREWHGRTQAFRPSLGFPPQ